MLAPVRAAKPDVTWSGQEQAWQARKKPDGLEAIDHADQELADLGWTRNYGSKGSEGPDR